MAKLETNATPSNPAMQYLTTHPQAIHERNTNLNEKAKIICVQWLNIFYERNYMVVSYRPGVGSTVPAGRISISLAMVTVLACSSDST